MRSRRAASLIEVLFAVAIVAVLLGPLLYGLMFQRRSAAASGRDLAAVTRATQVLELLQSLGYAGLPAIRDGVASDLGEGREGVARERWGEAFAGGVGGPDLAAFVPPGAPDQETFLWIRTRRDPGEDPAAGGGDELRAKELRVTVRYAAPGTDGPRRKSYELRTLIFDGGPP